MKSDTVKKLFHTIHHARTLRWPQELEAHIRHLRILPESASQWELHRCGMLERPILGLCSSKLSILGFKASQDAFWVLGERIGGLSGQTLLSF